MVRRSQGTTTAKVATAHEPAWTWASLGLVVLFTLGDLSNPGFTTFIGLTVVGPFLAATVVSPRRVAMVSAFTVVVAALLLANAGAPIGSFASSIRLGAIVATCVLAVFVAAARVRRVQELLAVRQVADLVQRAVLRPLAPVTGNVAMAARYRSAAEAARIGGDLYDAENADGNLTLFVGDVRGKGLEAVTLAASVLGSYREAVHLAAGLEDVVRIVDASVARLAGDEDFVTGVLVRLRDDLIEVASCGHPDPWLVPADGAPRPLTGEPDLPFGLGTAPSVRRFTWKPGDRLLVFTDGLTEARRPGGAFYEPEEAARRCRIEAGPVESCLDSLLHDIERHSGGRLCDDIAIVLVERIDVQPSPTTPESERIVTV